MHDVYTVDGPDPADGGLPETPVVERGDGTLVTAARVAPRVRYAVSYVDIAGKPLARDAQLGLTLFRVDGPMVILTRVRGVYPDTWGGRVVTYRRARCSGGTLSVRLGSDEHLFESAQTVTARVGGRVVRSARDRARRAADARRPAASRRARQLHGHVHRGEAAHAGARRHTPARRPLLLLRLPPMRIAFDVSPLSHERTGVNNYIRGSLGGLADVARERGDEIVAFAPTSPAGRKVIPEALAGIDVELALLTLPFAHAWRTAWSVAGRPAAERWLGSFDALHYTDWMYPPQRAGVRATTIHDLVPLHHPEWTTKRTQSMHGRKYRNAARTCDVVFANSTFTADDFAETMSFPRERVLVAHPGIAPEFSADGPAADLGGPYVLPWRRSSRARISARSSTRSRCSRTPA